MGEAGRSLRVAVALVGVVGFMAALTTLAAAHPEGPAHHNLLPAHASDSMRAFSDDQQAPADVQAQSSATCVDGSAGGFPCSEIDLLAFVPLADLGGTRSNSAANDIWGWTDPMSGKEYAIVGRTFGTSFVDISDPTNPVYLGELPTHGAFGSSWRDIKVYKDHAFIVSEARNHGMQVFDLTQLRNLTSPPVTFAETAHYSGTASAHNIAINEATGFAYVVGASGKNNCNGGLHMVDIRSPASPAFAGCFDADGYTHDTHCVVYTGPDQAHQGREICFNSNEDTLTIVDVTDKSNPVMLSRTGYPGSAYTHQGWLTEDHAYFLLDDEMDERDFRHGTRTRIFDVSDLDAGGPEVAGYFDSTSTAIDHNQYVKGDFVFQANYRAGLRVLHLDDVTTGALSEVGYFDVYPADDEPDFNGAWSNYPYFASGVVVVSGIEQGLFVLRPNLGPLVTITDPTDGATLSGDVPITADATSDVAAVEFFVGDTSVGLDETPGDGFSATWSTAGYPDGPHTITAAATNVTASHSIDVNLANTTATGMHVGDLEGNSVAGKGGRWDATVTVFVHDTSEVAVAGVTVTGSWSNGASGTASCETDQDGYCSVTSAGIHRNTSSVVFTVDDLAKAGYSYVPVADHATSITVVKS